MRPAPAFSNLTSVWARTVQEEAAALRAGADPPTTPLAYLLDQTAAVDDVAHGTLATLLLDLHECAAWGAAPRGGAVVAEKRAALLAAAEAALLAAKREFLPRVAAECGVEAE